MFNISKIIGKEFGMLQVLDSFTRDKYGGIMVNCRCKCGAEGFHRWVHLKSGHTKSCGCARNNSGNSKNKLFGVWYAMKYRCGDPNHKSYPDYGGRGIKVCEEWMHDFESFQDWAIQNGYKEGLTIDRKDNDKGYSPMNCRWITNAQQQRNKRTNIRITIYGETHILKEWAEIWGLNYGTVKNRYRKGERGFILSRGVHEKVA